MSLPNILARLDSKIRPLLTILPSDLFASLYSSTSRWYADLASKDTHLQPIVIPSELSRTISGLTFRSPICNAAGMYKYAEGYHKSYLLGAGAFLAGTTTSSVRIGNTKNGISLPFTPYPHSHSASNWLGLPNAGHEAIAKKIFTFPRYKDFPIGASVSADPGMQQNLAIPLLIEGIISYIKASVDFIEINESCPNVEGHKQTDMSSLDPDLLVRLEVISKQIIKKYNHIPVFVKFSNDININQLPELLQVLIDLGYSGINVGNTSTNYAYYRDKIDKRDIDLYDYFTNTFGGGLSGRILREVSLSLCYHACQYIQSKQLQKEFSIISTGGIHNGSDINNAIKSGASLTQWYTGYYEQYGKHTYDIYKKIYEDIDMKIL